MMPFGFSREKISFELLIDSDTAYESYGFAQTYTAPVTVADAFKYTTALNRLLKNRARRLMLGDATIVVWADRPTPLETYASDLYGDSSSLKAAAPAEDRKRAEEIRRFLTEVRDGYCRFGPALHWIGHALVLLSRTGMRVSELVAARWSDLDPGLAVLNIVDESRQGTAADRRGGRNTKSWKSRLIPIHAQARETLLALQQEKHADGWIMHMPDGQPLNAEALRVTLRQDVQTPLSDKFPPTNDGKSFIDGRLHSLRHFFCSYCANNNIPERTAMKWLGHSNSRMFKRYYHLKDDEFERR